MRQIADIHCHILPYVDDGALRTQESDELVRMQRRQGARVICCTPHLRKHMFETPDDEIRRRFAQLLERQSKPSEDPEDASAAPLRFFLSPINLPLFHTSRIFTFTTIFLKNFELSNLSKF